MEVILLEKVENLGNLGDVVRVRPGFGRNFLLPQGKARRATPENIKYFEERRKELELAAADALQQAQARAGQLEGLSVTVTAKASDEGKLFGSVGTADIADAVTAAGVEVSRSEVQLPEGPIRLTGEYEIELNLHADVSITITLVVEAEG